ncbi:MAG: dTDP-4-dehydrorhamnose 3,5-epimerase [Bacteroidetes bacterium]|nr:MAG: dTDP-4-dehydrorhamnose 3,5-epimerase [Bacteroidota bacterium]
MDVIKIFMDGPLVLQPKVFYDERGYFYESYNADAFNNAGIPDVFVQDNQSLSQKGALRGLHFQAPPYAQGKLVRVIKGAVYDVIVDVRKDSPTYGKHYGIELTEENFTMFWVPPGFAHGFVTLKDNTIFTYKCTNVYNKASEGGLLWSDPALGIDWNIENPIVSDKDKVLPNFENLVSPF